MNIRPASDNWERGSPYEQYIGRWSRRIAPLFLSWLNLPAARRWVDVGCGTGALSAAILDYCSPSSLVGIDPSEGFLELARHSLGRQAQFLLGSATTLPLGDSTGEVLVSGLVLNFVPDLPAALVEMGRVATSGGTIAAYVWDYADRMEVIKRFWDAAGSLDPAAVPLHEAVRFPQCNPHALSQAFADAGLTQVATTALDLTADFVDFDDYWHPFLGGQGPAPAYLVSLSEQHRSALRAALQSTLPAGPGGRISLGARAWAVRGTKCGERPNPMHRAP